MVSSYQLAAAFRLAHAVVLARRQSRQPHLRPQHRAPDRQPMGVPQRAGPNPPAGRLEKKGDFELKPDKQPIVFRTFMEGAGTPRLPLAFPRHAAFDSEAVGWTTLYGKFLDAESTGRSLTPLAKPLGTNIIQLPAGPTVGLLQEGKPWPQGGLQFRGYRGPGRHADPALSPRQNRHH